MKYMLAISKETETFRLIHSCFRSEYGVDKAFAKDPALEMLRKRRYDFVFIDLEILRGSNSENGYKASLQPFWHVNPSLEIIIMSSPERIREAVMAVKAGASNYLTYPINTDEAKYLIENIYQTAILQSELDYLRGRFWDSESLDIVQTRSPVMKKVFDNIRSVAPTKSTVLLVGETGTGKGVLAKLIHRHSNRRESQFISVHCGAIPDTLLESELFGHEKGAFTGAVRRKLGKFEIANEGTIFLDEIGTVTPAAQIKLLQVLQDGTFHRVGGEEMIETNVRVIAATNSNLTEMCEKGEFRKDLFYRLNVFPVDIPSLAERIDDIPLFAEAFLKKLNKFYPKEIHDVDPLVLEAFKQYLWPGNIRELENLMERAYILENSPMLTPESFPKELFQPDAVSACVTMDFSVPLTQARKKAVEDIEKRYLKELLIRNKGKMNKSAQEAAISTRQLHKLLKKYDIHKEDFK